MDGSKGIPEHAARVYYYLRDWRDPAPRRVYEALGLTKRVYYRALRWLLRYRFLSRKGGEWRNAKVNLRRCGCGAEITPASAAYTQGKSRLYVRKHCVTCYNAAQIVRVRRWDAQNPGYQTRLKRRTRQQERNASA
jgi:hypothetical protein